MDGMKKIRPIDANALVDNIKRYMRDYRNAPTRLTVCRIILSMLGDEQQTPTIRIPPAHIDREAWQPCKECENKKCDNCRYSEYFSYMDPCRSCESASGWMPMHNFCPECGLPLTPDAWAMLEKRLRG